MKVLIESWENLVGNYEGKNLLLSLEGYFTHDFSKNVLAKGIKYAASTIKTIKSLEEFS